MPKLDQVDLEPRYGGRFVEIRLFVNTEEDHMDLARRLLVTARGEKKNAATVLVGLHEAGEQSTRDWNHLAELSAAVHASPNASTISLDPHKSEGQK